MTKTILIVDDLEFVRKTLREIFSKAHYQVIGEATNGAEAVELYNHLKPDLVTMDIVMPKQSGLDATRKIMQMNKNACIVIISAMGQECLAMEAIHAGAKNFIQKPFTSEQVIQTIERTLKE